ncbi:hypothetical protein NW752_007517 [Fusarium irregulare]|uniref:Hypersensitive response-inducing protein n=1 Tax=Fusarium irregulare TaxID=2494466 RepID=A0A9W8U8T9_9HYPO|nr:hypothetical protein NW766_007576 [Fusarium irregulare]KAJ4014746.1 hypothetical protein NW752_007517 [Fusarium irregulare]
MKFSAVVLATAAATGATADAVFNVRDFTASCTPHSAMCDYSFNVIQPGTMDTEGYDCTAKVPGAGPGELGEVKAGTCLPSSRTFDVVRSDEGLILTVSVQVSPNSFTKGSHLIPNKEIKTVKGDTPTGDVQAYDGPKDFPLERVD